jgi:hypothetical protein
MNTLSFMSTSLKLALTGFLGAAAIVSAPDRALAMNPVILTGQIPSSNNGVYSIQYISGPWSTVGPQVIANSQWWGDSNLASTLTVALGNSPTPIFPNPVPGGSFVGNSFTDALGNSFPNSNLLFASSTGSFLGTPLVLGATTNGTMYNSSGNFTVLTGTSYNWAVATKAPLPGSIVPGPLPLVGAAAAFGFSRRLRSRIKKSALA